MNRTYVVLAEYMSAGKCQRRRATLREACAYVNQVPALHCSCHGTVQSEDTVPLSVFLLTWYNVNQNTCTNF